MGLTAERIEMKKKIGCTHDDLCANCFPHTVKECGDKLKQIE